MDSKQAKFVLQSWRASGADTGAPQFTEALWQVERDPELAEWFAREQALDAAIARKFKQAPVPEELRDRILAGRGIKVPAPPQRRRIPLALAASLIFLAVLAALWFRPATKEDEFAAYRDDMVAMVRGGFTLEFLSPALTQVQAWLAANRGVDGYSVPPGLQRLPSLGCRTWTWNGKTVALICFPVEGGRAVHLFITPQFSFPDSPSAKTAFHTAPSGWTTASWTEGDRVYLVASQGDQLALQRLLQPKG